MMLACSILKVMTLISLRDHQYCTESVLKAVGNQHESDFEIILLSTGFTGQAEMTIPKHNTERHKLFLMLLLYLELYVYNDSSF